MTVFVRTLGRCGIETAAGDPVDLPIGKPFAILVYTALQSRPVRRDELAALLWPSSPRPRALQSVRQAIWLLRQRLGQELLSGSDPLEIDGTALETDVARMTAEIAAGRVERADALWDGPFLESLQLPGCRAWDDWVEATGQRLAAQLANALHVSALEGPTERMPERLERAAAIEPGDPRHKMALVEVLLDRQQADRASRLLVELRRDAEADGSEVAVEALERRTREVLEARHAASDGAVLRPPFTDRVGELARLARLWRQTREKHTTRVLLRGPAGAGRTRLCEELAVTVRGDGGRVVRIATTRSDSALELGAVATLSRTLLGMSGARGVTAASDSVLRTMLPSLSAEPPSSQPHPTLYADALLDLVSAVAFEGPLVILIEDVQWLDPASRAVLMQLVRHVDREAVMFVLTAPLGTGDPAVERAIDDYGRHASVQTMTLDGLTLEATVEWVGAVLDGPAGAVAAFARRLHAASDGNPGRAVAGLRALANTGGIRFSDGAWRLRPDRLPAMLPVPGPSPSHAGRRRAGFAIAAVFAVGFVFGGFLLRDALEPGPPPWGGGEIWYLQSDSGFVLQAPPEGDGEWVRRPRSISKNEPGGQLIGPFITTDGRRTFYVQRVDPAVSPWLTRLLDDGSEAVVAQGPTDINAARLSPDGGLLAYIMDDPATPDAYDIGVVVADPDGGNPRLILQFPGKIMLAGWSEDGGSLLLLRAGRPDSVIIASPDGRRLYGMEAGRTATATWCGPGRVLFQPDDEPGLPLRLWDPASDEVRELAFAPLAGYLVCSPDGSAVIARVPAGVATRLALHDIETGETRPLMDGLDPLGSVSWVRPPQPVVDRVRIDLASATLQWGERIPLRATVVGTDGRERSDPVSWHSTDRRVLSISDDAVLTANRPGSASIVAIAGVWRTDTVRIEVTGDIDRAGIILADSFATIDTTRWSMYGEQKAEIVETDTGPVLSILGDGLYRDGLISREGIDLSWGATVGLEFRLPLSRSDRQQLQLLLYRPDGPLTGAVGDTDMTRAFTAVAYPGDELERFDARELYGNVAGNGFRGRLPASFTAAAWNRLALQVQTDGEVSIWVNDEHVATAPVRADLSETGGWHVAILGAAVETELHVRDLTIWRGVANEPPAEAGN